MSNPLKRTQSMSIQEQVQSTNQLRTVRQTDKHKIERNKPLVTFPNFVKQIYKIYKEDIQIEEQEIERQMKNIKLNKKQISQNLNQTRTAIITSNLGLNVINQNNPSQQSQIQSNIQKRPSRQKVNTKLVVVHKRSYNGYQQINNYEIICQIGSGAFATVSKAVDTNDPKKTIYAIKTISIQKLKKRTLLKKDSYAINQKQLKSSNNEIRNSYINTLEDDLSSLFIKNEIAILKKMNHKNITRLYDVLIDRQNKIVHLVLEYCQGGIINHKKNSSSIRIIPEEECKEYFKQIAVAIDYIHNVAKISHRDIKPQNILLDKQNHPKLSDFGLGTRSGVKAKVGTSHYMAPELKNIVQINAENEQFQKHKPESDIWSLGATLVVLLTGKQTQLQSPQIVKQIVNNIPNISNNCRKFILSCLEFDINKRIKALEMIEHPWLGGNSNLLQSSRPNILSVTAAQLSSLYNIIQQQPKLSPEINNFQE